MPPQERPPIFLDDIKDMLDPRQVKGKLNTALQLPEFGWRLVRVLGELLKSVMVTNDELTKLNDEMVELHKDVNEMKAELKKLNGEEEEEENHGEG